MAHRPAIVSNIQSEVVAAVVAAVVAVDGEDDSDDDSAASPAARTMIDPRRPVRRAVRGARADADAEMRVVVVVVVVAIAIGRARRGVTTPALHGLISDNDDVIQRTRRRADGGGDGDAGGSIVRGRAGRAGRGTRVRGVSRTRCGDSKDDDEANGLQFNINVCFCVDDDARDERGRVAVLFIFV